MQIKNQIAKGPVGAQFTKNEGQVFNGILIYTFILLYKEKTWCLILLLLHKNAVAYKNPTSMIFRTLGHFRKNICILGHFYALSIHVLKSISTNIKFSCRKTPFPDSVNLTLSIPTYTLSQTVPIITLLSQLRFLLSK